MKINAVKNNSHVTLILGTRHYQFANEKAEDIFDLALQYKTDPTEENLAALESRISKINVILHAGIIEETGNGKYYLKGYPEAEMPPELAETILNYVEKGYPTDALIRFWKLCMANPNTQARDGFYKYIQDFGIAITDKGYAILYKSVQRLEEADNELVNFISQQYTKIKRWKKAPKNYQVVKTEDGYDLEDYDYVEEETKPSNFIGVLQDLHDNLDELIEETDAYYVPHHSGGDYGNKIQLGVPVRMPRDKCDPDISIDCSHGLHVGARQYVKSFGWKDKLVLAVLVNPMNIVALPEYDHSKIRTCEYYPYGVMSIGDEEWEEIESGYFEEDYCDYEEDHIEEILSDLTIRDEDLDDEELQERVEQTESRLVSLY